MCPDPEIRPKRVGRTPSRSFDPAVPSHPRTRSRPWHKFTTTIRSPGTGLPLAWAAGWARKPDEPEPGSTS